MSSECQNEPKIHNTVNQCYEFWVHFDMHSELVPIDGEQRKSVI